MVTTPKHHRPHYDMSNVQLSHSFFFPVIILVEIVTFPRETDR